MNKAWLPTTVPGSGHSMLSAFWLARGGIERYASLTAALAAEPGVTVVHYDADFENAADILEFGHRWVLPRGTV